MPVEWIWGFAGGLTIGLAAAVFLLVNGRIMGASGLLGGLVDALTAGSGPGVMIERIAFLVGLIGVPALAVLVSGAAPQTNLTGNLVVVALAGLAVGIGTRMANGCTSGHGVCGISRLSARGIVATVVYLLAGGLTLLVFRHGLGVI